MISDGAAPAAPATSAAGNPDNADNAGKAAAATLPRTRKRYLVLATILLLATIAYADRAILSVAAPGIVKEFGLTPVQLGYVLSAFSWAYVIGQIPGGLLLDKVGSKKLYLITLVAWSAATILVGFVGEVTTDTSIALGLLFALRFALGFIEAPSFPANSRVTVMWFPKQERGLAAALFASASYFAVAIFTPIAGWLSGKFGWPAPFFALGLFGIAAAGVWIAVMHEPHKHPTISKAELDYIVEGGAMVDIDTLVTRHARPALSWKMVGVLLSNRMLWCSYIGQYCVIALSYFFITWFPIYLVQARGMSVMQAGISTVLPAVAGFIGGISGGMISDWLIRRGWSPSWARKTPYIIGMLIGCCLVLAAFAQSNVLIVVLMTLAFFGKGVATGAGTWAIACDTAPREALGLAASIFNCVGNIAGIVTPIVFGYIVQATGGYTAGLYFVAAHCLAAAVVYLLFMGRIERVEIS